MSDYEQTVTVFGHASYSRSAEYHKTRRRFVYTHGPAGSDNDTSASTRERLREATRYYERHVLAWYALGRVDLARGARAEVRSHQRALDEATQRHP